ncbi:MAG: hypothetical protein HQM08_28545 [Candidatus Riflebacteria bacterium]|nr:hypothetical protein [Candidatus Riflebacteria bacterium]
MLGYSFFSATSTNQQAEIDAQKSEFARVFVFVFVLTAITCITGCIGSSETTVYLPTAPNFGQDIDAIVAEFFASDVAQAMKRDAAALLPKYGGINVFTSAQYNRRFFTGSVDLGNVFDARIPANMAIFRSFASETRLINTDPNTLNYNRYSTAANRFLAQYGYDAVLFYPDEIHPLFTKPTDTWLYVRETPDGVHFTTIGGRKLYYSSRIIQRRIEIAGGLKLQAVNGNVSGMVYLPIPGEAYIPYSATETAEIATSTVGANLNVCTPVTANSDQIALRKKAGIVDSPLSNRKALRVGGWKDEKFANDLLNTGFSFFDTPDQYTWGQTGHYLVPLAMEFWK